jgi:hypothetical protein
MKTPYSKGNRRPEDWLGQKHFQVSGLRHRVPGSGDQARVLVPGLMPEPVPVPAPAAETCDPRMNPGFRSPFEFMARLDTESPPYPAPH